jgi:hypothetical protein
METNMSLNKTLACSLAVLSLLAFAPVAHAGTDSDSSDMAAPAPASDSVNEAAPAAEKAAAPEEPAPAMPQDPQDND